VSIRRRDFITLIGGVAAAWPLSARAQQAVVPVVGYLNGQSRDGLLPRLTAFLDGLREQGFIEGRNVMIEYRFADGQYNRLSALAADLVDRHVSVIASGGSTEASIAAKSATSTIPIVFSMGSDPVEIGLVASLNRPGGNITGFTNLNVALLSKRFEVLHELVPKADVIAVLQNASNPVTTDVERSEVQSAARLLGVRPVVLNASTASEIEAAFATLIRERVGALLVSGDSFFTASRDQLVGLSAHYSVPAIYQGSEFAAAGGLASYGASTIAVNRQVGNYVARILKGEKPADLPVQQVTTLELVINLKAAKALGVTVPPALLIRADEVIE
jgi:putative ABC transport system substrate-binding protein